MKAYGREKVELYSFLGVDFTFQFTPEKTPLVPSE
jgi:hypothetical protein